MSCAHTFEGGVSALAVKGIFRDATVECALCSFCEPLPDIIALRAELAREREALRQMEMSRDALAAADSSGLRSQLARERERAEKAEATIVQLRAALDGADCTHREGGDVRHCGLVRPCWHCRAERYREALTPSAATKAAFLGEFRFGDENGFTVAVPWTTVKEIMKAIRALASEGAAPKETKE